MKATILITGGSGFLGKRLALSFKDTYRVVLCARNHLQNMLAENFTGCRALPVDVTRIESVRDAVVEVRPDVIIHAAATKFVDLSEHQPFECVDVNVLGSENVARVALERDVGTVIGISTDKATPPVRNTYGLTKALMERVFCSLNGKARTKFLCVRFGNIAWASGSVFQLWKRMHDEGSVIGTTGPDMRRFFFTVDEAVGLVRTALDRADELQGSLLSRKMKAAKIRDILALWVKHRGGDWREIAGRPGERTDEYLIGDLELPYAREVSFGGMTHYIIAFNERQPMPLAHGLSSANTDQLSEDEILHMINNPVLDTR